MRDCEELRHAQQKNPEIADNGLGPHILLGVCSGGREENHRADCATAESPTEAARPTWATANAPAETTTAAASAEAAAATTATTKTATAQTPATAAAST